MAQDKEELKFERILHQHGDNCDTDGRQTD